MNSGADHDESCFQGELGSGGDDGRTRHVVIKTLKPGKSSEADAEDLDRELNVMQLLQHQYIVRLAGGGQMPEVTLEGSKSLSLERKQCRIPPPHDGIGVSTSSEV